MRYLWRGHGCEKEDGGWKEEENGTCTLNMGRDELVLRGGFFTSANATFGYLTYQHV